MGSNQGSCSIRKAFFAGDKKHLVIEERACGQVITHADNIMPGIHQILSKSCKPLLLQIYAHNIGDCR
ncbi:hypothetical protein D3C86_1781800 [compost metagenome]